MFTREELETIAALCRKWDAIAISDEIYEHIIYDGRAARADRDDRGHGGSDGHDQRPVEDLQRHRLAGGLDDFAAVADRRDPQGARFPDRRRAGAAAGSGRGRARRCRTSTTRIWRRAISAAATCCSTSSSGITSRATSRYGAYYIMTDISAFGFRDDVEFARYLVKDVGVAARAGQQLLQEPGEGPHASCGSASARGTRRCRRPTGAWRSWRRWRPGHCRELSPVSDVSTARPTPKYSPFSVNDPGVGLQRVADVERTVAELHADVVREVHRAVDVDVDVVALGP